MCLHGKLRSRKSMHAQHSRVVIVVDPGASVNPHLPVLRLSEKEPDRIRKVLRSEHRGR